MNDFPAEMQRSACTIVAAAAAAPVEAGWLTYGIKFLLQILGVPEIPRLWRFRGRSERV